MGMVGAEAAELRIILFQGNGDWGPTSRFSLDVGPGVDLGRDLVQDLERAKLGERGVGAEGVVHTWQRRGVLLLRLLCSAT